MSLPVEWWMAAAIIALYVYDCSVLLHWNEALLASPWPGRWVALFGSRGFTLRGLELTLAPALLPAAPVFRLDWPAEFAGPEGGGWEEYTSCLRPVQWCSLGVFLGANLLLPAALLMRLGDQTLVLLLGFVYGALLSTLVVVWMRKTQLGVSRAAFASLAFEVLACPPFGANMARRLSMRVSVQEDFISASRRLLNARQTTESFGAITARLRDEMMSEEEGTERHHRLRAREARLR